jgi:S-adenosylmethionine hydrolase
VAAHLSLGLAVAKLGPRRASLRPPADTTLRRAGNTITGEVLSVDRFGNLVTNIPAEALDGQLPREIRAGDHVAQQMVGTYSDAPPETLVGLIGSGGTLELALREQSAAARTGVTVGQAVTVKL